MVNENIHILLVSSKYMPEYSGSGFRAHNLYKRLTKKYPSINLTVLAGSETENENSVYDYDGFTVNRISEKPYPVLSNGILRKFQIALNFHSEYKGTQLFLTELQDRPDIIHIFGQNYVSSAVLRFAVKNKIPVLIELCNEMSNPHHYIPFPFKLWISGKPSFHYKFICISERLKTVCLRNGVREEDIWCRPNPVNEKLFHPVDQKQKETIRKQLTKFDIKDKLLVYVAKYIERKNHSFLLDVVKLLPEEYKLLISGPLVGKGPNLTDNKYLFDSIVQRIQNEGLQERVQAENGFCKNIEKYYQMADIYLFPTKEEGLGTPMLEAIACGIPVVANIIPGITDAWIKNNENGYLSSFDPEEFAQKVIKATDISKEDMLEESEKIVSIAGTEIIDTKYLELINELGI